MEERKRLRKDFLILFCVFFSIAISKKLDAQKYDPPVLKDFKVTIAVTENGVHLQSPKGSAWLEKVMSMNYGQTYAIDEFGSTKLSNISPMKDPDLADYLFTITKKRAEIILKGIEGTAWTELRYSFSGNQINGIDQNGAFKVK